MHLTKWKLAIAVVAIFSLGATAAYAGSVFDDVDDGQWYSDPIEWARDNAITTGCGDNNFCPTDPVTRRENVTFAYRYDQNIVQPALSDLDDTIEELEDDITALQAGFGLAGVSEDDDESGWDGAALMLDLELEIPSDGYLMITSNATVSRDSGETASSAAIIYHDIFVDDVDHDGGLNDFVNIDFDEIGALDNNSTVATAVIPVTAGDVKITQQLRNAFGPSATQLLYVWSRDLNVVFMSNSIGSDELMVTLGTDGTDGQPGIGE